MKYETVTDFVSPFHDYYDENDGIVYMWYAKGDILDDREQPFTDLSLKMLANKGLLKPVRNQSKEK